MDGYHDFSRDARIVRDLVRETLPSARIIGEPEPAAPVRAADVTEGHIRRLAQSAHDAIVKDMMRSHRAPAPSYQARTEDASRWPGVLGDLFRYAYDRAREQAVPGRGHLRNADAAIREYLVGLAEDERQARMERFPGVDAPAGQWPWRD